MAKVLVNDIEIEIGEDERLNGIEAAQRAGFEVPRFCWHPGLSVAASCRMCLLETGQRDPGTGEISMLPKLVPGCQTPAKDGTVFVTESERVHQARAQVEEALLINHPIDCPICDKAGECSLQDYHFQHGQLQRRADIQPFTSRRRPLGDTVTLFVDRCVMCTRCVRFCREISGTNELMVRDRGSKEEIDVFPGFPLENKMSGNVVDLCPVGALGDKDFLYSQRVWFMKNQPGVCDGCSTGCSIYIDENQDRIYRLRPRENPDVNSWWICDEGRYGFKHVHDERRQTQPIHREDGQDVNVQWSDVGSQLDRELRQADRLAALVSPHLTVEEAYLLIQYLRQIDPDVLLGLGPIPVVGKDEGFPGGFAIHAEKCPNRRGVEEVLKSGQGELLDFSQWLQRLESDLPDAVWISGGYKSDWIDEAQAESILRVPLVIVQDLFPSPLGQLATYRLPGAAFAERAGSYVNVNHHLQGFDWAIRPPVGVLTEGQLYWRLLGRSGLYDATEILAEISRDISYFSAAVPPLPAGGVDLTNNLVAGV
ncbi:MAG: ferredoxin [Planctomycetaceae bacterium]|nr:ferredoxin [Planctomycetaceae bacterium]MBP60368.1 ferredoxin [Planctomycetaceae bacterium]